MNPEREEGALFRDRADAGRVLASALLGYRSERPLVLGLPRGGVPVAYEVARALDAPLDVWVVRKLGAPLQPEYAIGAIAEGDATYVDWSDALSAGATPAYVEDLVKQKQLELAQRVKSFRAGREPPQVRGATVILVDDGIATGRTVRAAVQGLRTQEPAKLILAVPVAARQSLHELRPLVDEIVCPQPERHLFSIGEHYVDFAQTTDEEVLTLLERSRHEREAGASISP